MMVKKDVNNPANYEFKSPEVCLIKGCCNPISWMLDKELGIGMCDKCYNRMCDEQKYDM